MPTSKPFVFLEVQNRQHGGEHRREKENKIWGCRRRYSRDIFQFLVRKSNCQIKRFVRHVWPWL